MIRFYALKVKMDPWSSGGLTSATDCPHLLRHFCLETTTDRLLFSRSSRVIPKHSNLVMCLDWYWVCLVGEVWWYSLLSMFHNFAVHFGGIERTEPRRSVIGFKMNGWVDHSQIGHGCYPELSRSSQAPGAAWDIQIAVKMSSFFRFEVIPFDRQGNFRPICHACCHFHSIGKSRLIFCHKSKG